MKHKETKVATKTAATETAATETAATKTVAELVAATKVKFSNPSTVAEIGNDIADYINLYSAELKDRARQLNKGYGGRILDEIIASFYLVTGKGLTRSEMVAVLTAADYDGKGRKDVNGYAATFAATETSEMLVGCPQRVKRFRKDGLFCVVAA